MEPKAEEGPDGQGEAEGGFKPALGGPPVPDLRREENGESCMRAA